MEIPSDFRELLALFHNRQVEFLVVGGYALAFHGVPRATGDLDLWVRPDPTNAERVLKALEEFGFGALGLTRDDFVQAEKVIQLGLPPVRVDLLTSLTGVDWAAAATNSVPGVLGNVPARFIGKSDFIANKRATGRARDRADVEALGE